MGLYRFFLAILVLLSHLSIKFFDFYIGVIAVVNFLIVSGYLNTYLLETYYSKNKNIKTFYLDRACRIFPQYYFYFFLILLVNFFYPIKKELVFMDVVLEFPIIFNGYNMLFDNIFDFNFHVKINPPTWSLGLELTFYLIIPFIILFYKKNLKVFLCLSLIFFSIVLFTNSHYTDTLGYRLIPGTLYIFLIGSHLYYSDIKNDVFSKLLILIFILFLFFILLNDNYYQARFSKEVSLGVLIGIFFINYLKKIKQNKFDIFFGNLAYGIFLNHFFIIQIVERAFGLDIYVKILLILLVSITLSYMSYNTVEIYASKLRKKIRYSDSH